MGAQRESEDVQGQLSAQDKRRGGNTIDEGAQTNRLLPQGPAAARGLSQATRARSLFSANAVEQTKL